ncbi:MULTISPECIES: hypothetical protein [Pseudofrankia]|uniref:hypothetical protein n=1 Tax=Pseudofrankia TaxID=2994363 RepID=UPI000234C50F|nr:MULTISPECIES: hypothetical protein [Pseudofrankia]
MGNVLAGQNVGTGRPYERRGQMTNDIGMATTEQRQVRHLAGRPLRMGPAFARLARRAGQVVLAAGALVLLSAGAASAAAPVVEAKKERDAGDVTIGAVIIVVLLVLLFLIYRVIRKRLRG